MQKKSVWKMAILGILLGIAYWLIPDLIPTWVDDAVVAAITTTAFPLVTALRNRKLIAPPPDPDEDVPQV
ncbi:MAG: hypothetical protein LBR73_01120 [Oscillospiraceae bacterium]|jgi:hypothetical protein|nr:hypothetical protein [Oscillospiraceae bacterium]